MLRKVLVVDDDPQACDILRKFLVGKGYNTVEAYSGDKALAVFSQERPDAVLLDIVMPGMDGVETLRELKDLDPSVNVIMVTAVQDEEVAKQAKVDGALEIMNKPINVYRLENLLTSIGRTI
jgi:DNA-binding NtrC family response regulator